MKKDYVNKCSIAVNRNKTEVSLCFVQEALDMSGLSLAENPEQARQLAPAVTVEPVANLVMTGDCARKIATMILDALNRQPQ